MTILEIRKLAIHLHCRELARKEKQAREFKARLANLVTRFPSRISFGV